MNNTSSITAQRHVLSISKTPLESRIVKLIEAGTDLLSAIKGAKKDELIRARRACSNIGWRTEIAFDAALCDVEYAKRGRGNADKDGVGVYAAIRRQAQETKVSFITVKVNIRIFKTFFKNGIISYPILVDKMFFVHALRTKDPIKTIAYFEKMVSSAESFVPADAKRYAEAEREKRNTELAGVISKQTELSKHIEWAKKQIIKIKEKCPNKKFAERLYTPLLDDLEDHLAFMAETEAESRCRLAWERGYHREGQIAQATRLNRKVVAAAMMRLSSAQEFYEVQETTHGRHDKRWQKAGVPVNNFLPDAMRKTG